MKTIWNIETLSVQESPQLGKVVVSVYWSATLGERKADGMQLLEAPDPSGFVPFDQLTQELVWGWLDAYMPASWRANIERQLETELEKIVVVPFPSRN